MRPGLGGTRGTKNRVYGGNTVLSHIRDPLQGIEFVVLLLLQRTVELLYPKKVFVSLRQS